MWLWLAECLPLLLPQCCNHSNRNRIRVLEAGACKTLTIFVGLYVPLQIGGSILHNSLFNSF